jgi:hypothetical protein
MSSLRRLLIAVVVAAALTCVGCTIGYRYHHLDSSITNAAGNSAQVEGSGHTVEMGIVFDFRVLRAVMPYVGANYELDVRDDRGGGGYQESMTEARGFRLDLPALSLWSDEGGIGYPGTMVHRQSVELWLSGTIRPGSPPLWWSDVGLVYYHHDAVAVRAYGGWGQAPFTGTTTSFDADGVQDQFWEASVGGPTAGVELTLGAGEQMLDFFKFFLDNQDTAGKPPK